jgi:DNA-directed RNA polymerase II subunit RPB2
MYHAQKTTIGKIVSLEELPYTTNGIKPDIIFNPMPIFKRKTFGHLYEGIISKIATLLNTIPFEMKMMLLIF